MDKRNEELTEIVEKYGKIVSSLCNRIIYDKQFAEDATQEVWLEVFKSISNFKGQSKLSTWIYTIAYRVIINYSEKQKKYSLKFLKECLDGNQYINSIDVISDIEETMEIKDMCNKCLTGILHCFDSETKMLYIFRGLSELSYQELSELFQIDETCIRQRISRARRKLRNFLNDECILFNNNGKCRCKIKNKADKFNLVDEYKKIRNIIIKLRYLNNLNKLFHKKIIGKNFSCHKKIIQATNNSRSKSFYYYLVEGI